MKNEKLYLATKVVDLMIKKTSMSKWNTPRYRSYIKTYLVATTVGGLKNRLKVLKSI